METLSEVPKDLELVPDEDAGPEVARVRATGYPTAGFQGQLSERIFLSRSSAQNFLPARSTEELCR